MGKFTFEYGVRVVCDLMVMMATRWGAPVILLLSLPNRHFILSNYLIWKKIIVLKNRITVTLIR